MSKERNNENAMSDPSQLKSVSEPYIREIEVILEGIKQDFRFTPTEDMEINTRLRFRNIARACELAIEKILKT